MEVIMNNSHPMAEYIQPFFHQYLSSQRGLSFNSILAYRDSIKLLLCFSSDFLKKAVDQLNIEELDDEVILAFLDNLEKERENCIRTRNARLAAICTFFGFIGREKPEFLNQCRKIRSIPQKRTEHKTVEYLESKEMKAVLNSVDMNSRTGTRDKALLLFLYNTGARVQEVVDIKFNDLRLENPGQVKLLGKGKKQRACPLWPDTIDAINDYLKHRQPENSNEEHLFLNANGESITRFGIRHITKKYAEKAAVKCSSLNNKVIGPHTFRHSTAMHLIQAGNDINMVKLWLGHANLNTTHMYVEINMEMKRKILDTCQPPCNKKKNKAKKWLKPDVLKWLNELGKRPQLCEVQ